MSFRIQNNIASINSNRHLNRNSGMMDRSLERLSSGYRINTAADDAAGMASSMRFRAEISSLKVASQNAAETTSLLQVAEGAMSQIDLILNRLKELATQAASGNSSSDRAAINQEATALTSEIDRIVEFTQYNDTKLLDGNYGSVSMSATSDFTAAQGVVSIDTSAASANTTYDVSAVSTASGAETLTLQNATTLDTVTVDVSAVAADAGTDPNNHWTLDFGSLGVKLTVNSAFDDAMGGTIDTDSYILTTGLGNAQFQIGNENNADNRLGFSLDAVNMASLNSGSALSIDLSTQSGAQSALADIDTAITYLAGERGDVGALINRLGYASSNLAVSIENKTASESVIRDVDMASEMSNFTKNQILVQAGTAMLAQANTTPQAVLTLIR